MQSSWNRCQFRYLAVKSLQKVVNFIKMLQIHEYSANLSLTCLCFLVLLAPSDCLWLTLGRNSYWSWVICLSMLCQTWVKIISKYTMPSDDTLVSLQLKRGLFWYWHHHTMHEMVSDRSSGVERLPDLRKKSVRVIVWIEQVRKHANMSKIMKTCSSSWEEFLRSYRCHTKSGKKQLNRCNPIWFN